MSYLRATYLDGSITTSQNQAIARECDLVCAYWTTATSVDLCRRLVKPGGLVGLITELALVRPSSRVTSAAGRNYADAKYRGLLSDVWRDTAWQHLKLNDAAKLDAHLAQCARNYAEAPDSRRCHVIVIDAAGWSYGNRVELGAPSDPMQFKAWAALRMFAFWCGLPITENGLNSWGDSVPLSDDLAMMKPAIRKFESGWTWPPTKYGIGPQRLAKYLGNVLASMRLGVDVIMQWCPLPEWTAEQVRGHMIAGAFLYCWLRKAASVSGYAGKLYWMGDRYAGGGVYVPDDPRIEDWLNAAPDAINTVSVNPSQPWATIDSGWTYQLVLPASGSSREPLAVA